jgi:hypothetical protein
MRRHHPWLAAVLACTLSASGTAVAQTPPPPSRQAPTAVVKGIVVVPHTKNFVAAGVPEPAGQIDIARVPALNDPALIKELRRYLGLPIRRHCSVRCARQSPNTMQGFIVPSSA